MDVGGKIETLVDLGMRPEEAERFVVDLLLQGVAMGGRCQHPLHGDGSQPNVVDIRPGMGESAQAVAVKITTLIDLGLSPYQAAVSVNDLLLQGIAMSEMRRCRLHGDGSQPEVVDMNSDMGERAHG